jgi:hypothetical protein
MAKSKVGVVKSGYTPGKPKRTRQGQGVNSKPSHGRKKLRGQGKG